MIVIQIYIIKIEVVKYTKNKVTKKVGMDFVVE